MEHLLLKNGERYEFRRMEMMGIINVTPDSFYEGSRTAGTQAACDRAEQLITEGALFLDIGGESTRPGAKPVSVEEEIRRICPVITLIKEKHPDILLSADTYHADTARAAIEAGVDLINDISGLTFDPDMADVIAEAGVPLILMHTGGRPEDMQENIRYTDAVEEVYCFFEKQMRFAEQKGILRERIMLDVGIGFGKTCEQNLALLKHTKRFQTLGRPLLLAASRKSFIGQVLSENDPGDRLYGTIAVTLHAASQGIRLARVHDVRANLEAVRMYEALNCIT